MSLFNPPTKPMKNKINHACLGLPGCNHPIEEDCKCSCHLSKKMDIEGLAKLIKDNPEAFKKECGRLIAQYEGSPKPCPNKIPCPMGYHSGEVAEPPVEAEPAEWIKEFENQFGKYMREIVSFGALELQLKSFIQKLLSEERAKAYEKGLESHDDAVSDGIKMGGQQARSELLGRLRERIKDLMYENETMKNIPDEVRYQNENANAKLSLVLEILKQENL